MPVTALLLASASAPVVDIDGTIYIQAVLFLLLMALLHPLLFKPWLATQARREEAIEGTKRLAAEVNQTAERIAAEVDARLGDVRGRAEAIQSEAVKAGDQDRQRRLGEARSLAAAEQEVLRQRLTEQASAARATLSARIDELAHEVAAKVLGRAL